MGMDFCVAPPLHKNPSRQLPMPTNLLQQVGAEPRELTPTKPNSSVPQFAMPKFDQNVNFCKGNAKDADCQPALTLPC
jgi:hypothetical protein